MEAVVRRIWWTVGIVAALLMILAIALVMHARQEAERAPSPLTQTTAASASAPRESGTRVGPEATVAGQASTATVARGGAPVVEVCGLGPVRLSSAASEEENDQQLDEAVGHAPVPWVAMQASSDERIRAAGFALAEKIEPLVKLAAATRDASVYGIAQSACARVADDPSADADIAAAHKAWCALLSPAQRATLEPDNTIAWLQLAADADTRRDNVAVDEALRRAAAASLVVHHTMAAVEQVDRHGVATAATASNSALWIHRALGDAGLHSAVIPVALCGDRATASRREHCVQISERLLNKPQSVADLALGLALGKQVGLDESMLTQRRQEMEAVQAVDEARTERWNGKDRYACAVMLQQRDWLRKNGSQGEWRSARDAAVAKAGGSMEALLRRHQEGRDAEPQTAPVTR
jgi:hypothetical protein